MAIDDSHNHSAWLIKEIEGNISFGDLDDSSLRTKKDFAFLDILDENTEYSITTRYHEPQDNTSKEKNVFGIILNKTAKLWRKLCQ